MISPFGVITTPGAMVILFGLGLTTGLVPLPQDPEVALHEAFAEGVTAVVVGVGLGEPVTVAAEDEVASLPVVDPLVAPEVGLALGAVVTA